MKQQTMDFKEYQTQAQRTCPDLGSLELNLAHMVLGMNSELEELAHGIENEDIVNIGEEVADFQWYFVNYCRIRGIDTLKFGEFLEEGVGVVGGFQIAHLFTYLSRLQDYAKKFIAYGKPIDVGLEMRLLVALQCQLSCLLHDLRIPIESILIANIAKLKARYPDKFTTEDAINRDLDKERSILEQGIKITDKS
jgi:NTP pyrophosphatase (non-canonical NTP hydrolase)